MKIFSINKFKTGILITLLIGAFFGVLALVPDATQAAVTGGGCDTQYTQPIFNPYPVTYGNVAGCIDGQATDFAIISGGVHGSGAWAPSFSAQAGDSVTLMVYVHNGAASNSGAVMHDVSYNTVQTDSADGTTHTFTTTLSGSNAVNNGLQGSVTIYTPAGSTLQVTSGNLSGTIGDLQPCFEYFRDFFITLTVVGPTAPPPPAPSANLTINDQTSGNFTVGDAWTLDLQTNMPNTPFTMCGTFPDGTVSCTPNWGMTDDNGNWTQSGSFSENDAGTWFEHVEFPSQNDFSSNEITFNVAQIPPPVTGTVSASVNSANFCVYSLGEQTNDTASYSVQGSSNLAGQQILWSSTKDGVSTGEVNSYYGQNLDSSAFWSGLANRTWNVSDIGTWTKTASVFNGNAVTATAQPVSFIVRDCSTTPPPALTAALVINGQTTGNFTVGDAWTINLSSNIPNTDFRICATHPNGVSDCTPVGGEGRTTDANGHWYKSGNFSSADVGSWLEHVEFPSKNNFPSNQISFTVSAPQVTPAPTVTLTANPSSVVSGSPSTLNWTSANATACTASGDWSGAKTVSGSEVQNNLTANKTYTITCTGPGGSASATAQVAVTAPVCPLAQITSPLSASGIVGQAFSYTFAYTSASSVSATSIGLSLPGGLALSGNTISGTPTQSGTFNIPLSVTNACGVQAQALAIIISPASGGGGGGGGTPNANISVVKTENKTTANVGDTITYTIQVTNHGPETATNARVSDILSGGLTFVSATPSVGSYSSANGVWTIGNLANGASATLTLNATVNSGTQGTTITNTATGASDVADTNTADNTSSVSLTVNTPGGGGTPTADLTVTKTADKGSANVGDTVTYVIRIINNGPNTATNSRITDLLPAGLTLVSATPGTGSYNNTTGVWTIGDLASGNQASTSLTIRATVNSGTQGTTITNTAVGASDVNDSNTADNTGSASFTVNTPGGGGSTPNADVSVSKSADKSAANTGDTVTYIIKFTNNGPDTATNARLTDTLPGGMTLVSATSTSGSYATSTGLWTLGDMMNGASSTLTLVGTVNSGTQGQTITNTASGTSDRADSNTSNNTSSVSFTVNTPGGGGGGGGGGGIGGHRRTPPLQGEILGTSTCFYLRDFLKIDWPNDPVEVLKLQSFLNVFEGENLSLTGVYDQATFEAVERFQAKYSEDILMPWGDRVTAGFTYILTRKKVNEIFCRAPFPLTADQEEEISLFRVGGNPPDRNAAGQIMGYPNSYYYGQMGASTAPIIEESANAPQEKVYESTAPSAVQPQSQATTAPVISLSDGEAGGSAVKNAAISLWGMPRKIFSQNIFLVLLLILILVAIIMLLIRYFTEDDDSKLPMVIKDKDKDEGKDKNKLPDEEIVIEDEEEDL